MLSERSIAALKPKARIYRVADRDGLCVEVRPTGSKFWRYRFRFDGRAQMMTLGRCSDVSLKEARALTGQARRLLDQGLHPLDERRRLVNKRRQDRHNTFKEMAILWIERKTPDWDASTLRKAKLVVEGDLIPALDRLPIATIASADVIPVIKKVEDRAPSLARKARQYVADIVRLAIQEGRRPDGTELSLKGVLRKRDGGHIPAATDLATLADVLRRIDAYDSPITRSALQLAALTQMRPAIIASASWEHIDLERALWRVPGSLMKMKLDHEVSLPRQAIDLLKSLPRRSSNPWVFPAQAKQKRPHINRDSLSAALRRMGLQGTHATHGFRASMRTIAREELGIELDVLEAQLAHSKGDDVRKAYDRTKFIKQRTIDMQRWADFLDKLRTRRQHVS